MKSRHFAFYVVGVVLIKHKASILIKHKASTFTKIAPKNALTENICAHLLSENHLALVPQICDFPRNQALDIL